jgi:hypothetical protein
MRAVTMCIDGMAVRVKKIHAFLDPAAHLGILEGSVTHIDACVEDGDFYSLSLLPSILCEKLVVYLLDPLEPVVCTLIGIEIKVSEFAVAYPGFDGAIRLGNLIKSPTYLIPPVSLLVPSTRH